MGVVEEGLGAVKRGIPKVFSEFKNFISKGSALDLAIGVVIGAAFNTVVQSLVKDVVTPIVSVFGTADFSSATACLKSRAVGKTLKCVDVFRYGSFVTTLIAFTITAASVFFFVVLPLNRLRERRSPTPTEHACPYCKSKIPLDALKCPFCTADLDRSPGRGAPETGSAPPRLSR